MRGSGGGGCLPQRCAGILILILANAGFSRGAVLKHNGRRTKCRFMSNGT
jgi:hypothetical protein